MTVAKEKMELVKRRIRALTGLYSLLTGSVSDSFVIGTDSRVVLCTYIKQIFMEPATGYMEMRETSSPGPNPKEKEIVL